MSATGSRGAVVHVLGWTSRQYGSFERFLVRLSTACEQAGLQTHVVAPLPPTSAAFVADLRGTVHVVPLARHPLDRRAIGGLRRVLARTGATHVHAHFGLDAYLALAVAGSQRRFTTKHATPGVARTTASRTRHRWLAGRCETVFAVSAAVADGLVALGIPRDKVTVAHIGVDADAYRPDAARRAGARAELDIGVAERVVLCTSHLRPGKGVELLPGLAAGLAADPGNALVLAAGAGPMRAELEAATARLGLAADRLRWLGQREDIPDLLAAADVFVFPTTGNEGLPLGTLEALASGVAVVSSGVSDLPRLLEGSARVVAPGDAAALLGACRELLADDAERAALGARGRALAIERLGVGAAVTLHVEHYLRAAP